MARLEAHRCEHGFARVCGECDPFVASTMDPRRVAWPDADHVAPVPLHPLCHSCEMPTERRSDGFGSSWDECPACGCRQNVRLSPAPPLPPEAD